MKKNVVWLVSMTTTLFFVSGIGLVGLAAGGQPAEANLPPINGRIAYSDYSSIWTMESDGSDKKALFGSSNGGLRNPAWSPDGTKLAYIGLEDATFDLYAADFSVTGTFPSLDNIQRLTDNANVDAQWGLSWGP